MSKKASTEGLISMLFHSLFEVPEHGIHNLIFILIVGKQVDEQTVLFKFI